MSDVHYMLKDIAMPQMDEFGVRSPGHEGAGLVVQVGLNVKNWKVGDRAGIKPMMNVSVLHSLQVSSGWTLIKRVDVTIANNAGWDWSNGVQNRSRQVYK